MININTRFGGDGSRDENRVWWFNKEEIYATGIFLKHGER